MGHAAYALTGFRAMVASDLQGGAVTFGNNDYDCTAGTFSVQQVLNAGGFSPMLLGDVQIARADLPDQLIFHTGQAITVTPNTGPVRQCQIHAIKDMGVLVDLTLCDANEAV